MEANPVQGWIRFPQGRLSTIVEVGPFFLACSLGSGRVASWPGKGGARLP